MIYGHIEGNNIDDSTFTDLFPTGSALRQLVVKRSETGMKRNGTYIIVDFKVKNDGSVIPITLNNRHATVIYHDNVNFVIDFHGTNCVPQVCVNILFLVLKSFFYFFFSKF